LLLIILCHPTCWAVDILQWDIWRKAEISSGNAGKWFGVTRWNVGHPTRLAFEGVALLALVAAGLSAAYDWSRKPAGWALITGFALAWALGALATWRLHQSFNRASET